VGVVRKGTPEKSGYQEGYNRVLRDIMPDTPEIFPVLKKEG
jgi:hypothetical protein